MWRGCGCACARHAERKSYPVFAAQYKALQRPVKLAKQIVALAAHNSKQAAEATWKHKLAKELDIEVEASDAPDAGEADADEAAGGGGGKGAHSDGSGAQAAKLPFLERELGAALLLLANSTAAAAGSNATVTNSSSVRRRGLVVGGRQQLDGIRACLS